MSTESPPPAESPHAAETPHPAESPRTRWAAIIWGMLFAAVAVVGIRLLADESSTETIADALMALTPTTFGALALLTVGVLILVTGAVGLVRHLQRRWTARRV